MKALLSLTVLGAIFFSSFVAQAVELQEATNAEIIAEIRLRMGRDDTDLMRRLEAALDGGGVIQPVETSQMTFSCSDGRYFFATNSGRVVGKESYLFRDTARCFQEIQNYSSRFNLITAPVIMAVCDSNGYLIQTQLSPNGTMTRRSAVRTGDMAACLRQAESINSMASSGF